MPGGSTAVTVCPLNQHIVWRILDAIVNKDLKRVIGTALDSMPDARQSEVAGFIVANHGPLIDAWNWGNLIAAIDRVAQRRQRIERAANPLQGWLPLPEFEGFQNIPAEVQEDTLEQYRETIAALERKIKFYANPRRSAKADKMDRQQLREMKRLEPLITPFFAGDPTMTVGRAVELYRQQLASPMVKKAKKAITARWNRRTGNQ